MPTRTEPPTHQKNQRRKTTKRLDRDWDENTSGIESRGVVECTHAWLVQTAVACQHVRRTATQSSIRHDDGFVPRRCTLDGFAQEVALTEGVGLAELESLTTLLVRTDNSLYRITVLQPPQPKILVQGGRFFPETTEGRLEFRGKLPENGLARVRSPDGDLLGRSAYRDVACSFDRNPASLLPTGAVLDASSRVLTRTSRNQEASSLEC